jgi:hypothetical protein
LRVLLKLKYKYILASNKIIANIEDGQNGNTINVGESKNKLLISYIHNPPQWNSY